MPDPTRQDSSILGGLYGRVLLPAVIFQSILIGGGYATGREVVEYAGRLGALGLWSIAAAGLGFALVSAVAYEFARTFRAYNYRAFMRTLIGPLWPLFDLLFLVMVIIVIAVMASAAGALGQRVLGLPEVAGVSLVIGCVALFNFRGSQFIEKAKTFGTLALYSAYIVFAFTVLSQRWSDVTRVLSTGDSSYAPEATVASALGIGVIYVAYNLAVLPAMLFTLHRQKSRSDAAWAGVATGILSIVPFILTYLCLLSFYPDEGVLGAQIPWLEMLTTGGGPILVAVLAGVVIFTLIETAVGNTHAMADRLDDTLVELGRKPLTPLQSAIFTGSVVLAGALLSRVGIVALVAQGYTAMAYGFLALFALPLLTVGVRKIRRENARVES